MIVTEYESAKAFLNDYVDILLEREAISQLVLYNAYQKLTSSTEEKGLFGAVLDEEATVLLFCNVEPFNLVIYIVNQDKDKVDMASTLVADFLAGNHIPMKGITAKYDICQSFISQYKKSVNCTFVEMQGMDIMEIRKINDIKPVEGMHRLATINEAKLITDWMIQYQIEALASEMDYEAALKKVKTLIENNKIFIFENSENKIVSMAATTRKLVHGIAISFVFTPEEFRGKGYAAANVYCLSKNLLESGYEFCTLFVDKKNPVSSRAYEKVGYTILDENFEYKILPIEG